MDVNRLSTLPPPRSPDPPIGAASLPAEPAAEPTILEPAVRVELGSSAGTARPASGTDNKARVAVDGETRELLFQVVEGASGTVVVQIPDERTVKARLYAREVAARTDQDPRSPVAVA